MNFDIFSCKRRHQVPKGVLIEKQDHALPWSIRCTCYLARVDDCLLCVKWFSTKPSYPVVFQVIFDSRGSKYTRFLFYEQQKVYILSLDFLQNKNFHFEHFYMLFSKTCISICILATLQASRVYLEFERLQGFCIEMQWLSVHKLGDFQYNCLWYFFVKPLHLPCVYPWNELYL